MPIAYDNKLLYTDISSVISAVNAEAARRAYNAPVSASASRVETVTAQAVELLRRNLNTVHSKARAGKIAGTAGGAFGLTNYYASLAVHTKTTASIMAQISTDIGRLASQCDCNTYSAVHCDANGCNPNCVCYADCACNTNCACNGQCNIGGNICCHTQANSGYGCTCLITCLNCCNSDCACHVNCACNTNQPSCCNTENGPGAYGSNRGGVCSNGCGCDQNCSCEFN